MGHIFISYSKKNIEFARYVRRLLQAQDFPVWMDETRLVPSERWWPTIESNIETCDAFIIMMSPEAKESVWVEREILLAEELKKPIFPLLLTGSRWSRLADIQYEDLRSSQLTELPTRLLDGLDRYVGRTHVKAVPPQLPGALLPAEPMSPEQKEESSFAPSSSRLRPVAIISALALLTVALAFLVLPRLNLSSQLLTPTLDIQVAAQETRVAFATQMLEAYTDTPAPKLTSTPDVEASLDAQLTALALQDLVATADALATLAFRGITANTQWQSVTQVINGVEMVLVPVGCFSMGTETEDRTSNEHPTSRQCFEQPFWLDKTEVTNAQFAAFNGVADNPSNWSDPNLPRETITWDEARDYCTLRGGRLPTEAEWEYAARGPDNLIYPWGNEFVVENVVYHDTSNNQTADAGSRPDGAAWVGALDLSGNVWEWTASIYQSYPYQRNDGREEDHNTTDVRRVLRGGSFNESEDSVRSAYRYRFIPDGFYVYFGFRCLVAYQ